MTTEKHRGVFSGLQPAVLMRPHHTRRVSRVHLTARVRCAVLTTILSSPDSQLIGGRVWVGDAQPLPVDPSVLWSIPLLTAPKHGPAAWYLSDLNISTCAHIYHIPLLTLMFSLTRESVEINSDATRHRTPHTNPNQTSTIIARASRAHTSHLAHIALARISIVGTGSSHSYAYMYA